jgi:hypothetical protein
MHGTTKFKFIYSSATLTVLFGKLNLYLNVQSMYGPYGSVHALGITHQIGRSGLI